MPTWNAVDGLIHALSLAGDTHSLADVVRQVEAGEAQVWQSDNAVIVTEVKDAPRKRIIHFWLAAGKLDEVIALSREVLAWAKSIGCERATLVGRKGWVRALRNEGWGEELVMMGREVV